MADFSALKTAIQTYIKQNGNEEITGEILQEILLSVVTTLGDSAINDLVTALANEVAARQNADGTLQQNITNEATARGNADTALSNRLGSTITAENTAAAQIGAEAEARAAADTALQGLINGVKNNVDNGYVYAGIATPSSTPATGKVFYLALTAGTYTNFGNTEVSQGINILKYNGSAWSLDTFIGIDDAPTPNSLNLVKSGGAFDSVMTNGSAFDISAHFASGGTLATYADLDAALAALNTLSASYKRGGMSIKFVQSSDNKYVQARCMAQNFTTDVTRWQGVDDKPTVGSDNLVKSGGVYNITGKQLSYTSESDSYVNVLYQTVLGKQYIIKNLSKDKSLTLKGRNENGESLVDIVSLLAPGFSYIYTGRVTVPKLGVLLPTGGSFYIADKDTLEDEIKNNDIQIKAINESIAHYNYGQPVTKLENINKNIVISGNVGETASVTLAELSNWGYLIVDGIGGCHVKLVMRGGTSSPSYTILDKDDVILQKDTFTNIHLVELDIPANGYRLILNNDFVNCPAPFVDFSNSLTSKEMHNVAIANSLSLDISDLINKIEKIPNKFISPDNSYSIASSNSWDLYKIDLSRYIPTTIKTYTGDLSTPYIMMVFYNSLDSLTKENVVGIVPFFSVGANVLTDIVIPKNAKCALVGNRKASGTDIYIKGFINIEKKETEPINYCSWKREYKEVYIDTDGSLHETGNWKTWLLPLDIKRVELSFYSNYDAYFNIGFYSGKPSASTFISGIHGQTSDSLQTKILTEADIPLNTQYVLFASRVNTGDETSAIEYKTTTYYERTNKVLGDIISLQRKHGELYNIYKKIHNHNDFIIIKNELWLAENIYEGGVITENTNIFRYRFNDDFSDLFFIEKMLTNFGHWNSVDYCEENDCLVFSNSANDTSTEGNYFHIIKNPLSLHGTIDKDVVGIKYEVDLGYKVNLVWGDSNIGKYNILYALSNNGSTFSLLLLGRDSNGDFNGNYVVKESKETTVTTGINGIAFWGDTIYFGSTSGYKLTMLSLTDMSNKVIERSFYDDNGNIVSGTVQGVVVTKDFIWLFLNVGGSEDNYLLQYWR